jgi:hypothetical protein
MRYIRVLRQTRWFNPGRNPRQSALLRRLFSSMRRVVVIVHEEDADCQE